ncbi:hypothetical protein LCGC14_1574970, partial [marine sediment metagenome]
RDEHRALYKQAIDKWGEAAQIAMVFEECAELMLLLSHARRGLKHHSVTREDIVGEIADVSLGIEQLCCVFNVSPSEWFATREDKLRRLKDRLK